MEGRYFSVSNEQTGGYAINVWDMSRSLGLTVEKIDGLNNSPNGWMVILQETGIRWIDGVIGFALLYWIG